jgi:protein-S-isoprenylcysteine O-methyltransferase Ste14
MTFSFWLILLAALAYGLLHSLLASQQTKTGVSHRFGPHSDRWYRLAYNFIAIVTLLPILLLPIMLPDKEIYAIQFPWLFITAFVQLMAIVVLVIGLRQTGIFSFLGLRQLYRTVEDIPAHFVKDGLYRYVRHPLYTAGLVFIWLIPYLTWNVLALILGLTIYIVIGAHYEERKLEREFGEAYAEYRRQTPMFVPGANLLRFKRVPKLVK